MADWLRRLLEADGYTVQHVKNITDVGHMREDQLQQDEDRIIAAARAEGKPATEIARFYTEAFLEDETKLNILPAGDFPKATQYVPAMVAMAKSLVDSGSAYEAGGNVYFSVSSFPAYGKLSGQKPEDLQEGVRGEPDPLKRDPRDFALWKAAEPGRDLKWESPWGDGFPGWHIECSAMSRRSWATRSTSTPAASTTSSPTTRTRSPRARPRSATSTCATGYTASTCS